ncbi:MAG: DUF6489 family protein [Pseudomonadota bacterium]
MKVNVEIDCTPQEARAFFGMPDLTPVHEAYVKRMTDLAKNGIGEADVEAMMKNWMAGMSAFGNTNFADLGKAMFGGGRSTTADR